MTNDDAPSSSLRKEDEANERRRTYARNKTIDLKRDDAYALVRIELEKKTKTNGDDDDDNELLPKGGGRRRAITSTTTTTTDAPAALPVPKMTRGTFLEIIENALLVMRGSIGGNIEKHVLHFENEDEKSKTAGVSAVRVKRKDLETFTSALRGYDRLYKTTENSEDVGLRIEIVCVANSLLDVVGIERERDAVGRLLRGGD